MSSSGRTTAPTAGALYVAPPTGVAATDTANLQAALNASSNGNPKTIILATGTYQLNAELAVPFAPGTKIIGQGSLVTTVMQNTAGANVFAFRNNLTHTINVERMTVTYNAAQTNPGSVAFFYQVAGGSSGGFFHHHYYDLTITNAYDGFKLADNDNQQTLWDTTWDTIQFHNIARRLVSMAPATAIGIPELHFRSIYSDSAPTVAGAQAFVFTACEANMEGIGLEKYKDTGFFISGGGFLKIAGLHVENHSFDASSSVLFSVQSSTNLEVNGFSISGANTANNTNQTQIAGMSGGNISVMLRNGTHNVVTLLGASFVREVIWSGVGATGFNGNVYNVTKTGGGLNQIGTGTRGMQTAEYFPNQGPAQTRIVTANYNVQAFDRQILANGASLTVTLLDPTLAVVGQVWSIKNVAATAVTVNSAGVSKTIDGAATATLAQWAHASYVSDGTQWLSV